MKRLTWRDKAIYSVIFSMLGSFLRVTKTFNNQPGSPSVYLEGINLSAARSTPSKLPQGLPGWLLNKNTKFPLQRRTRSRWKTVKLPLNKVNGHQRIRIGYIVSCRFQRALHNIPVNAIIGEQG